MVIHDINKLLMTYLMSVSGEREELSHCTGGLELR